MTIPCSKVPLRCDKKSIHLCKGVRSCRTSTRNFSIPRLYSPMKCKSGIRGYTAKASCKPFTKSKINK